MFACFSPFSSEAKEEGGMGGEGGGGIDIQATMHMHSIHYIDQMIIT